MKTNSRVAQFLAALWAAGALALSGSLWAQSISVNASVSGSTLSVSATGSTTSLASGTYNATVNVTNSSGQVVSTGSQSFVIGGGTGTMSLTTVDGRTYSAGMTVTGTAPQVCGIFSNPADVLAGYIAVMEPSGAVRRFQLLPAATGSSFCANIVLDAGSNTVWAAHESLASRQLVYSTNQLTVNNSTTGLSAGSVRIQLTWDKVNDLDLHLYSPASVNGIASTSSYGEHIYWDNKNRSWGQIDIEKVASNGGLGPENITINSFPTRPGRYLIAVNAYSVGSAASTNCVLIVYTGSGQTLASQSFTLTRTGQTYLPGYLNVTAGGTYTLEALGTFAGDGSGQIIEPAPGYVPPPKN